MPSTSMNLSHPKSGNGLLLRWPICMGSNTFMSLPSPVGTPWICASCTWTTARSSTSARSINLVNNPVRCFSPNGTPAFPQTHDGDPPACWRVHHSSLGDAWSRWHVAVRRLSRYSTVNPWHCALRVTFVGEHVRRTIDAWRGLEDPMPLSLRAKHDPHLSSPLCGEDSGGGEAVSTLTPAQPSPIEGGNSPPGWRITLPGGLCLTRRAVDRDQCEHGNRHRDNRRFGYNGARAAVGCQSESQRRPDA
jgi:hypothetical protein